MSFYKVTTSPYRAYFVTIKTQFWDGVPVMHSVNVGGQMKGCVEMVVNIPLAPHVLANMHPLMAAQEVKKNVAKLTFVGYNPKCSVNGNMPGGSGTRHMIRTAMSLVLLKYDWISGFQLTDNSEVFCKEGLFVSLSHMSLVKNGQTYYQKYFGAQLVDVDARRKFISDVAKLSDATQKLSLTEFAFNLQINPADVAKLASAYEASTTYIQFFSAFNEWCAIHDEKYCEIINGFLVRFIMEYIFSDTGPAVWSQPWIIRRDQVDTVTIDEAPLTDLAVVSEVSDAFQKQQETYKKYQTQHGGGRFNVRPFSFGAADID